MSTFAFSLKVYVCFVGRRGLVNHQNCPIFANIDTFQVHSAGSYSQITKDSRKESLFNRNLPAVCVPG